MLLLSTYCMVFLSSVDMPANTMLNRMMLKIAATYMAGSEGGRTSFLNSQVFFHKLSAMAGSEGGRISFLYSQVFFHKLSAMAGSEGGRTSILFSQVFFQKLSAIIPMQKRDSLTVFLASFFLVNIRREHILTYLWRDRG